MTTQKDALSKTAIARMEKNLAGLLAEVANSNDASDFGKIGAYAQVAIDEKIAGDKDKCEFFGKQHFDAVNAKREKPLAESRKSEWVRAMVFAGEIDTIKAYTMSMVHQVRDAGEKCHIHNTANSILGMYRKNKKDGLPAPTQKDIDAKVAKRLESSAKKRAAKTVEQKAHDALTDSEKLVAKIAVGKELEAIAGLLERMAKAGCTGTAAVLVALDGVAKPVVVAPVAAPTPATPAPEAGTADLAAQMATMQANFADQMNAMAALVAAQQ